MKFNGCQCIRASLSWVRLKSLYYIPRIQSQNFLWLSLRPGLDERRYEDSILAAQSLLRARFWLHLGIDKFYISQPSFPTFILSLSFISPVSFQILIRLCDTLGFCIPPLVPNHSISASSSTELDFLNVFFGGASHNNYSSISHTREFLKLVQYIMDRQCTLETGLQGGTTQD